MKKNVLIFLFAVFTLAVNAQSFIWVSSTENNAWKQSVGELQNKKKETAVNMEVTGNENVATFRAWGTCFNELGWDALNMVSEELQETILGKLFSPRGDLRFTIGCIPMNANDYARDWYSCDEVDGDFELKYFNIDRDKQTLVPYIKRAQRYNPDMTFWISPWSPPSWMKINHHYACKSGKYNDMDERCSVDSLDYDMLIQDPRYLDAYARYFCKFIDAYKEQGIPVTTVMYQNEAYSHWTDYPGCSWSAEGTAVFNAYYLAPALAKCHPDVDLYLGTINSSRLDIIERALANEKFAGSIKGVGLQWEGALILPKLKEKYPTYKYVQTESECGSGTFDWNAAEHTFNLINYYLGNGCEEYTFWNAMLCDEGLSGWGWRQNSLIRIDSKTRTATYTPEYYAVEHYSHYIEPGSRLLAFRPTKDDKLPILIFITPENNYVIVVGNFNDTQKNFSAKIGTKYLNAKLQGHSFNTFILNNSYIKSK